jgi:diguanylate cyclase (GGDEF)-like protein
MIPPQPIQFGQELSRAALDALPDAVFMLDRSAAIMRPINSAAGQWLGRASLSDDPVLAVRDCLPELDLNDFPSDPGHAWLAHWIDSTGSREVEIRIHGLANAPEQAVMVLREVATGAASNSQSSADAFHDPLTGLANRRLFARRLERAIERSIRSTYHFAVLFIDLDDFKDVNDRFGHVRGDHLLVAVARRLVEAVRPQDMVARRDGDEFTVLLDDLERPEDAVGVAQRIADELKMPLAGQEGDDAAAVTIAASIGIALSGDSNITPEHLIARADAAMYHAKAIGGGTYMLLESLAESPDHRKPLPR